MDDQRDNPSHIFYSLSKIIFLLLVKHLGNGLHENFKRYTVKNFSKNIEKKRDSINLHLFSVKCI